MQPANGATDDGRAVAVAVAVAVASLPTTRAAVAYRLDAVEAAPCS